MNTNAHHVNPATVTKTEAARLLGVSRNTLLRILKTGVIDEIVLAPGLQARLRLDDVLALAEHREASP